MGALNFLIKWPTTEYGSCGTASGAALAKTKPLNPPKLELWGKPMIQNSVVVEELRPDRIGANRFIVLIAVGIAVIVVTEVW